MPTTIHFVRHAQGFHNLSAENHSIRDPILTDLGKQQCEDLAKKFAFNDKITHLVASPMRRTLFTCLLSFDAAVKSGKKVVAVPEIQEVGKVPCDIGSDPEVLRGEFGSEVDLSRVHDGWNDKSPGSKWEPNMDALENRAREARLFLRALGNEVKDAHIVAVTHGGFLHILTQDYGGFKPQKGTGWENTEYRTYEFVDASGQDPDAAVKETDGSWRERRGSAIPLTETEQRELKEISKAVVDEDREKIDAWIKTTEST